MLYIKPKLKFRVRFDRLETDSVGFLIRVEIVSIPAALLSKFNYMFVENIFLLRKLLFAFNVKHFNLKIKLY